MTLLFYEDGVNSVLRMVLKMKKLAIIPAYNESENVLNVIEDLRKNAPEFDYIVVNDCSKDDTCKKCIDNSIPVLDLSVNLGIGGAVQTGYLYGRENGYDIAVQFDGDGQHKAAYLEKMLDELNKQSADMVIGSRFIFFEGFQSSFLRRMGIKHFRMVTKLLTGKRITDVTSGMRMVSRGLMCEFAENYPEDYPEPESVVWALKTGRKVIEIPVTMRKREGGKSSISFLKSIYYMIKVTIAMCLVDSRRKRRICQ